MFASSGSSGRKSWLSTFTLLALPLLASSALADIDRSLYMTTDELRPGMKGYGKTVLSGTNIQTFNVEVISVVHNSFYAKQDVILVRCSGLNLENTGIIGGMSGSPCYIRDDQGRERMIGAVAYGWSFNKEPICGVQPIAQMLEVGDVRKPRPETQPAGSSKPTTASASARQSGGIPLEDWIARASSEPIPSDCRLSVLNRPGLRSANETSGPATDLQGLRPLDIPVSVSSLTKESMTFLERWCGRRGLTPVAAAGAASPPAVDPDKVRLEPGSTLCIALITGDLSMEALGTCTTVIGDKVLGFGHQFFAEGDVEYPLATGYVHTVIPSVLRSEKMGGALKVVGTLWGDESTAISGTIGKPPAMVPVEVTVNDIRGKRTYRYEVLYQDYSTATFLSLCVMESVYAHNDLPRDHSVRHRVEVDLGDLGTYTSANFSTRRGTSEMTSDLMYPLDSLLNPPLVEKARIRKARVEVDIEDRARSAQIYHASLPKKVYKPGETVTATVRWSHYRKEPMYTYESYSMKLPEDIPDGDYDLTLCSVAGHLSALRSEKPHLFRAETLSEALAAFNMMGSFSGDRLYMRLGLKQGGMSYKQLEMPDLPASRRKILSDSKLTGDLGVYSEALVVEHKTDFVADGKQTLPLQVKRHPDQ